MTQPTCMGVLLLSSSVQRHTGQIPATCLGTALRCYPTSTTSAWRRSDRGETCNSPTNGTKTGSGGPAVSLRPSPSSTLSQERWCQPWPPKAPSERSKESIWVGHFPWQDEAGLGVEGEGGWAALALFTWGHSKACSSFLAPSKPASHNPLWGILRQGRNLVQGISSKGLNGI